MPFYVDEEAPLNRLPTGGPLPNPKLPTTDETVAASFGALNPIVSLAKRLSDETYPVEDGHNPKDIIGGTRFEEFHSDSFIGSRSTAETKSIMRRLEGEDENDRIRSASGVFGTITDVWAGLFDPTILFPAGTIARGVRGGYSALKSARNVGAATGLQVAAQEGVLQVTQETRSGVDSAIAVGSATILGGLIGAGASRLLGAAERKAMVEAVDGERASMAAHVNGEPAKPAAAAKATEPVKPDVVAPAAKATDNITEPIIPPAEGAGMAQPAGAAAARADELVPVSYGFDKIPGWSRFAHLLGTDLGIYSSKSVVGKRLASEIFETTLRFRQNLEGEVTAPVVPLDREVSIHIGQTRTEIGDEVKGAYAEYFFGAADTKMPFLRAEFALRTGKVTDKLTPDAFEREISAALQAGDRHALPQVERAAQFIRRKALDPWSKRMEAANSDFKRQEFKEGESYFPYSFEKEMIAAERPKFVEGAALPHLKAQQTVKAAAKERLQTLNAELAVWNKTVGQFEGRLESLAARQADLESRLEERAMEVSRSEARAGAVEERAASIAEDLSEIADFIATMRKELKDPALLARLDVMEKDAAALRKADRPVTEADLRKIEKQEVDAVLTGQTRVAAEMLTGRRAWPKVDSFLTWLVMNGGIKDVGGEIKSFGGNRARPGLLNNQKGQSLDSVAEKIKEEAPGHFPELDEPGGGAPSHREILEWIDEALRGRDPAWWQDSRALDKKTADATQTAAILDEIFREAGITVTSIREVGQMLRDGRLGEVTLKDLDKIAAEMEAAGQSIPLKLRRAELEETINVERENISEVRRVIGRAMSAREATDTRLKVAEARGEEAGLAERANRGRLGVLQDRLDRAEQRRQLLADAAEVSAEFRDRARVKIEAEIAAWEGKSAGEAKSALKQREKYEELRRGKRNIFAGAEIPQAEAGRLTGADDAVDRTVKRIIDSDRDLSDAELRDLAEEITDHILGTPIGRIPYDAHITANEKPRSADRLARGPLKERDFAIPYALAKDWLSHDLDRVLGGWMRTMVPDTLLHERFPGEGPAMTSRHRQIQEEYVGLVRAATSAKERTRLNKEKDKLIETLEGVTQRIRGLTNNTEGMTGRIGETVRRINQMTDLGFAAVTSIPDFAGPIFYHGLTNVLREGWLPYAKYIAGSPDLVRMSKAELRAMNVAVEIENSTRGHALAEISETYHPRTSGERAVKFASDRFFLVNMQAPETQAAKQIAGTVAMGNFLRAIKAEAEGVATKAQVVALRESNVDTALSKRIWAEFNKPDGGATIDGTMLPNTGNWTDDRAKMHFIAAITRDVERAVITPGAEKPLWLSTNAGGVLGQFKTFSVASGNKLLISNLQRRDAQSLQGAVASVALGVLSYRLSTLIRGDKWPERPQDAIKEGINRSGLMGPLEDVNMFLSKGSRGTVDIYRLIGADKPLSRNANRSLGSSLLGPTFGKIENVLKVTGALGAGEWTASDTHATRRLTALQNVFYLHRAFNAAEEGFNSALGIPQLPPR